MKRRFTTALAVALSLIAGSAVAETPVEVSLFPPLHIAGPGASVKGLRLVLIYGENAAVCVFRS